MAKGRSRWRSLGVGALAAVSLCLPAAPNAASLPAPQPRDLLRQVKLADPQISPDGKTIALVETRVDLETNAYASEILLVDVATRTSRRFTSDRKHAAAPRWSPGGERLAFVAPDAEKALQIFVAPMTGGDPVQITHGKDSVQQFAWRPDGESIAFARSDAKPEADGEARFRTAFKVGDDGFTTTEAVRPSHIWLIAAAGGDARRLTNGPWSLPPSLPPGQPSSPLKWTPDGESIVFVRQETPSTGQQDQVHIQILDVKTGAVRNLTNDRSFEAYPVVSHSGSTLAYWRNRDGKGWMTQDVWTAPLSGGAGHDCSLALDKNIFSTAWTPDDAALIVSANVGTTVGLWKLPLKGAASRLDLHGITPMNTFWSEVAVGDQGQIAFIGQSKTNAGELYLIPPSGGAPEALTHENAALEQLSLARSETIRWRGPQGRPLEGVLTYPSDYRPGQRYPLVLYLHGGPILTSKERFSIPQQAMAGHGWFVFEPNYRGSDSQDNAFLTAIYGDAGEGPGADVMSGVEHLKTTGMIDPSKMATTGWSYGGFMTVWLAGHYPVWKAAVAGAALTDWVEEYDLSDNNVANRYTTGASPYVGDGLRLNRRQSPSEAMTRITAPTLILSTTGDVRVPVTQSFGLYHALKDNHAPPNSSPTRRRATALTRPSTWSTVGSAG
jgi:dipeptidyl aminopeptidase/acylaminoacyl peptidase